VLGANGRGHWPDTSDSAGSGKSCNGAMAAAGALIEMAAECGGATTPNGPQDFEMLPAEPVAVSFDEGSSCSADQIGHLQRWPGHLAGLR
jgi:hypothetical protein